VGYEVSSVSPKGEPRSETRDSAQEAVALAMRWLDRQHKKVQVLDRRTGQLYREQTLIDLYQEIEGKRKT
jgi:hypothetical protein